MPVGLDCKRAADAEATIAALQARVQELRMTEVRGRKSHKVECSRQN